MPPEERYQFLLNQVLPHQKLRLMLTFAPTHPAPIAFLPSEVDQRRLAVAQRTGEQRVQTGGELVSPVLDLIAVAASTGRLDDLSRRVEQSAISSAVEARARLAIQILIMIERKDFELANRALVELMPAVHGINSEDATDRTAATLVTWAALQPGDTRKAARELLASLHASMLHAVRTGDDVWDSHLFMLTGFSHWLDGMEQQPFALMPQLSQWYPGSRLAAQTRGEGWPLAHWQVVTDSTEGGAGMQVDSLTGHNQDYLYFLSPLRGDFHIECDVTSDDWSEGHLLVAGQWVSPFGDAAISRGTIRDEYPRRIIPPRRPAAPDRWMRYRVSINDGRLDVFFDGHQVHSQVLSSEHDPWVAIRSRSHNQSSVRDVRISGNPVVPSKISLAVSPELEGWHPYFNETVTGVGADWEFISGVLIGRRRPLPAYHSEVLHPFSINKSESKVASLPFDVPDVGLESLLQYHRPMFEDGTIEFEFFYQPDTSVVHPALDRLVLLLAPEGVRVHWLTDGPWDRTRADPLSATVELDCRRGPKRLPLIANQWNRSALELTGNTIRLKVNGRLVYERPVEPTNQRQFGLFHYSDRSEARVRNIVWRGDWPRHVPAAARQELADPRLKELARRSAQLAMALEHDFAQGVVPPYRFQWIESPHGDDARTQTGGLRVVRKGAGQWVEHNLTGLFSLTGDFDIAATFDGLWANRSDPAHEAAVILQVLCQEETDDRYHIGRRQFQGDHQIVETMHNWRLPGGSRDWNAHSIPQASRSGTLRLVRHGAQLSFLFAEGPSQQFRLVDQQRAAKGDVPLRGVRLLTQALGEGAETRVTWKSLRVRAEQISELAPKQVQ